MSWTNSYSLEQTGAFLKQVRKEKGYTQQEFADLIGVSHATLSALENGGGVSAQTLEKAWQYLGPVSYTHLDVYKRQRRSWSMRAP